MTRIQNPVWLWPAYHWIHALVDTPIFGPGPFFAMDISSGQSGDGPTLDSAARAFPLLFLVSRLFLWLSCHPMGWSSSAMGVAWQFPSIPIPPPVGPRNGMGSGSSIPLELHHPTLFHVEPE